MDLRELVKKSPSELSKAELAAVFQAEARGGIFPGELPFNVARDREMSLDRPSYFATEVLDHWYRDHFESAHYQLLDDVLGPWVRGETVVLDGVEHDPKEYTGLLVLWSRSTVKSTMLRIIALWSQLWRKLRVGEDARSMFVHQTYEKAVEHSEAIRTIARQHPKFRASFPEFAMAPSGEWDTKAKWRWPNFGSYQATEWSWTCYGGSSSKTGGHYTDRFVDDWVTEDSVTSPTMLEQSWARFVAMDQLRDRSRPYNPWIAVGTHYHFQDTYRKVMENGGWLCWKLPAFTGSPKRIFDICSIPDRTPEGRRKIKAKIAGLEKDPPGVLNFPKLLPWSELVRSARVTGPAEFNCFPGHAPVLMADWTEKHISAIKTGDMVIGWDQPESGGTKKKRRRLRPVKVLATWQGVGDLVKATFESRRIAICTPDHKWFTGRNGTDEHRVYAPLGMGEHDLKGLISVCDMPSFYSGYAETAAGYLGGIFDGEGHCTTAITLHQCDRTNHEVVEKIRESLYAMDFEWSECRPKSRPHFIHFILNGGHAARLRFLKLCDPAKSQSIVNSLNRLHLGKTKRDKMISYEPFKSSADIYNIRTETGNYVAYGYATKNCQLMLNPVPEGEQRFDHEALDECWVREIPSPEEMWLYVRVDPAISLKKDADETAILLCGVMWDATRWLVDGWIGREKRPTEIVRKAFTFARKWQAKSYTVKNIGFESVAYQEALAQIARGGVPEREAMHHGESVPMLTKPCAVRSITRSPDMRKHERILQMDGPVSRREMKIWTQTGQTGEKVIQQFKEFPFGKDDALDSMHDMWGTGVSTPPRAMVETMPRLHPELMKLLGSDKKSPRLEGTNNTVTLTSWGRA